MLKVMKSVLFWLVLVTPLIGQEIQVRNAIVPLKTNRREVERNMNPLERVGNMTKYKTKEGMLEVYYSAKPCIGHGWNIPANRVLTFVLYPKNNFLPQDLIRANEKFIHTASDDGMQIFTSTSRGFEYFVRSGSNNIDHVRFTPTTNDRRSRCKGFPPYNAVTDHYSPYQEMTINSIQNWDVGLLGATFGAVQEKRNIRGAIFIYCSLVNKKNCALLKEKIDHAAKILLRGDAYRLTIAIGGFRESDSIESFITPSDWPEPLPRPLFTQ